jgi:hypothetical protein
MLDRIKKFIRVVRNGKLQDVEGERIGNWEIEFNRPFGFVVRNNQDCHPEYHFFLTSNGWVTTKQWRSKFNKDMVSKCINAQGQEVGQCVYVDKLSAKKYSRFIELKKKGKKITPEETQELLALMESHEDK